MSRERRIIAFSFLTAALLLVVQNFLPRSLTPIGNRELRVARILDRERTNNMRCIRSVARRFAQTGLLNATIVAHSGTPFSNLSAIANILHECQHPIRVFVTYSDGAFQKARSRLVREAALIGDFDLVVELSPQDIDQPFRQLNKQILDQKRGGGYWLWKPWATTRVASLLREGDFLAYLDAGCFILRSLEPWFQLAASKDPGWVVLEINEHINRWTKGDLFSAMGLHPSSFANTKQVLAGVWVMRVTKKSMGILHEWLRLAQIERLLTDQPSLLPNPSGFVEHRHDQSIFSLLVRTNNISTVLKDDTFPHDAAVRNRALVSSARSRD